SEAPRFLRAPVASSESRSFTTAPTMYSTDQRKASTHRKTFRNHSACMDKAKWPARFQCARRRADATSCARLGYSESGVRTLAAGFSNTRVMVRASKESPIRLRYLLTRLT